MAKITNTGRVLLGLVGAGVATGYEMKALIDRSTRFFWGASAGGIYPELHRLEADGLVVGTDDPQGARRRRTYELTDAGRQELDRWLAAEEDGHFELRHEGMLRLFLAASQDPGRLGAIAQRVAGRHRDLQKDLEALLTTLDDVDDDALVTLRFGIALNAFIADWFEREASSRSR